MPYISIRGVEHYYQWICAGDRAWYYKDNRLKITTTTSVSSGQSTIIRTERELAIAGTRITLYQLMDYICAGYPPTLRGSVTKIFRVIELGIERSPFKNAIALPNYYVRLKRQYSIYADKN